jgi:RNA polymerase sigma-70 factor (ECF subfamily)
MAHGNASPVKSVLRSFSVRGLLIGSSPEMARCESFALVSARYSCFRIMLHLARGRCGGGPMESHKGEAVEAEIRRHYEAGAFEAAAAAALRGYGREILSFLMAVHKNEADASEVFSIFCEEMWRSLPRFSWQCSFRTWAYTICRYRSQTYRRGTRRRAAREGLLESNADLSAIEQQVRTETLPYLRSQVKSRISELRDSLSPEEQEILILRVDRQLAWPELAQVMAGEDGEPLTGEALKRDAARLRKRFQAIKEKLREMARREGLVDQDHTTT